MIRFVFNSPGLKVTETDASPNFRTRFNSLDRTGHGSKETIVTIVRIFSDNSLFTSDNTLITSDKF